MKILRFNPSLPKEEMLEEPIPAKKMIPEWYKSGEMFYTTENSEKEMPGLKTCKPFIDVMISGYFILTPFDISVSNDDEGNLRIDWEGPQSWAGFVGERPKELGSTIPVPAGHRSNHLVWSTKWGWKTPRGWSSLVTHPFNRSDLPFRTSSGIIDSDRYYGNGNIPFHLKEGFEGIIPKGTPYAQVIPIKRSPWRSFIDYGISSAAALRGRNLRRPGNGYKEIEWVRKEYE